MSTQKNQADLSRKVTKDVCYKKIEDIPWKCNSASKVEDTYIYDFNCKYSIVTKKCLIFQALFLKIQRLEGFKKSFYKG